MVRLLIPILLLLASCRTTKNTQTTRVVTDSTTERALREHVRMLETELQTQSKDSAIKYITDIQFEECDSAAAPATATFDNGKLVSVTGQLRSVRQQLSEEVAERYYLASVVDSQSLLIDSLRKTSNTEYVDKIKEVERRYIPIWVWAVIAGLGLMLLRAHWPRLLHLFIKPKTFNMHLLLLLGTWPVGLALLVAAGIFFYYANKARNSGWKQQMKDGSTRTGTGKLPWFQIGQFWLGLGCVGGFIAYLIIQWLEA